MLFFIELKSRRVYLAGCTPSPNKVWVTQQARQVVWHLSEAQRQTGFLIHDRDAKFCAEFDSFFVSEGIVVVLTPFRAPQANATAERWVRSVRRECLDQILILNQAHLTRVLNEYISYYSSRRPHQGLEQQAPMPFHVIPTGTIHRRKVLGGVLHDYFPNSCT